MKSYFKKYNFILITMAPLHIGSGSFYTQKEYIYENNQYLFPDKVRLYQKIGALGSSYQKKYEGFLLQNVGNNTPKSRLIDFLNDNKIKARDFGGYAIQATGLETEKKGQLNQISQFVRDPYGNPYIPGSSLKGALRTILVNEKFTEQDRDIPWGARKSEKFNDIFHEIYVSDSQPLKNEDLILTQKWDFSKEKSPRKASPTTSLPVFRECLRPLLAVRFVIQVQTSRAAELIDSLMDYAEKFYQRYKKKFLIDFPSEYQQDNIYAPLYLGAGSGLWTKTDIDHVKIEEIGQGKLKMKGKGVLKLTKFKPKKFKFQGKITSLIKNNGNFYEMGKANFIVKEIKE
jgi:CRISPR-associated protein Csm5